MREELKAMIDSRDRLEEKLKELKKSQEHKEMLGEELRGVKRRG